MEHESEKERSVSEAQNQQQGGQQPQGVVDQAQDGAGQATQQVQDTAGQVTDQAGRVTEGVRDAVGGIAGGQQEDGVPLGGVMDQAQNTAGQAKDQVGQVADQAQDAVGGLLSGGQNDGQSGEQAIDDYSYSDSDATTVENDKTPKGILGQLLNLDILPPPQSDTTTLESGDSGDYYGSEEPQQYSR